MSDAPPAFKVLKPSPSGKRITFKDGLVVEDTK